MAPLLGVPEPHHAGFGRLGLAFQHANFIRDVREDRKLDRIYLPGEDRDRFGVEEADFDRPAATPELRALMAHEVRRARGLFASAESAVEAAPASVRPGIRLACTIYLGVLDRVEALGYDVLGRRPRLPAWQLPLVAHEVRRARELFAGADAAVEAAPASVRPGIRLACAIYLGVLDRVEAIGYDVLGRRPRLPAWQLPLVAVAALRR